MPHADYAAAWSAIKLDDAVRTRLVAQALLAFQLRQHFPFERVPVHGLIVLAGAVFLSVTSETMPTGLLPDMSASLNVSEPAVGLLVTIFAFTVVPRWAAL